MITTEQIKNFQSWVSVENQMRNSESLVRSVDNGGVKSFGSGDWN